MNYQAQFFSEENKSYWTIFIEYELLIKPDENKQPAIELSAEQELIYTRLKEWRKEKAESQGVPVYVVAKNQILIDIALKKPESLLIEIK